MLAQILLATESDPTFGLYGTICFAILCISTATYYIVCEWRKKQQTQIEADLKREMIQKGLAADDIERVLKASSPPRE